MHLRVKAPKSNNSSCNCTEVIGGSASSHSARECRSVVLVLRQHYELSVSQASVSAAVREIYPYVKFSENAPLWCLCCCPLHCPCPCTTTPTSKAQQPGSSLASVRSRSARHPLWMRRCAMVGRLPHRNNSRQCAPRPSCGTLWGGCAAASECLQVTLCAFQWWRESWLSCGHSQATNPKLTDRPLLQMWHLQTDRQ